VKLPTQDENIIEEASANTTATDKYFFLIIKSVI
jgi:hypothetical protein